MTFDPAATPRGSCFMPLSVCATLAPMSRTSTLIALGVLTILTPFSGLPSGYRTLLIVFFGTCVCGVGLLIRSRETRALREENTSPLPSVDTPPSEMSSI